MSARSAQGNRSYPLMLEQEEVWVDERVSGLPSRYLESWVNRLTGPVDRVGISYAFSQIAARHEALRSRFILEDEGPVQVVLPPGAESPPTLMACPAGDLDAILRDLVRRPMDLEREAVRISVLDVAPQDTIIVVQIHHILIDDWSLHIIEQEFEEFYLAYVEGRQARVSKVTLQPGAYALAQRAEPPDRAARRFWRGKLSDLPDATSWDRSAQAPPTVRPAGFAGPSRRSGRIVFRIEDSIVGAIRTTCRSLRVTPFTLFATAAALLLRAEDNKDDVLIGCPVSRRTSAPQDLMIAPLTSMLLLRVTVRGDTPVARVVADVRACVREAMTHSEVPFSEIMRLTRTPRAERTRLVPISVVVDDSTDFGIEIPGVTAERIFVPSGFCKFDADFYFLADGDSYFAYLDYAIDLFDESSARQITEDFKRLLLIAAGAPESRVSAVLANP